LRLPSDPAPAPIIVVTKRVPPRRHGGAWKVAYADFVTALLALFIVLWMMNSSAKVKASISGYFHDPRGYTRRIGAGPASSAEGLKVTHKNVADIQKEIEAALQQAPEFQKLKNNVRMSVTGEGLRIDLLETDQGMFFETGSPNPTGAGEKLLGMLGGEIGKMPNAVVIEGHTDARPFRNAAPTSGYSNWELSADRANAARRLLNAYGVRDNQVVEIRGYANQMPLNARDPNDTRNRRVSVVVRFNPG
jgi:chemotaxis protein MotB